ncbi:nitroreductase family protein [Bifidobacterium pullorum subsp. saeculare]|uniref:Nitroreductase family protein n=1 Tax=Bifidobacterium pullorum subsp. saeculare TaxID=78257 RepID=A0A938WVP0_9BIFI|nr:nitroreductase family protein [Bifidobacterium pullorum]MBM6699640.1 nitroreductase family protein [Bifidobacterium pullorum subsp. saeculare]
MGIKTTIRHIVPDGLYQWMKKQRSGVKLRTFLSRQRRQFMRTAALPGNEGEAQLEALLQYHAHEIEKGLSHNDFRAGFGRRAMWFLADILARWEKHGYSWNDFGVRQALSVLRQYKEKHAELGVPLPDFFQQLMGRWTDRIDTADLNASGAALFEYQRPSEHRSYSQVLMDRVSLRNYSSEPVDEQLLVKAGTLAMRAPSVCNRQSARLYVITDSKILEQAMDMQAGMYGYAKPPALLMVTSKISTFVDVTERNEPYIDGGLYSMALLGALEELDLAACPLNTMFEKRRENGVRSILNLPDDEVLIMFIAVGHKPERTLHPKSLRRSPEDIITCIR